jgi:hypothetical protein
MTHHWVSKCLADMQINKIFTGLPSPAYKDWHIKFTSIKPARNTQFCCSTSDSHHSNKHCSRKTFLAYCTSVTEQVAHISIKLHSDMCKDLHNSRQDHNYFTFLILAIKWLFYINDNGNTKLAALTLGLHESCSEYIHFFKSCGFMAWLSYGLHPIRSTTVLVWVWKSPHTKECNPVHAVAYRRCW